MSEYWIESIRYTIFLLLLYYFSCQIMLRLLNLRLSKYFFIIPYYCIMLSRTIVYDRILFPYLNQYDWYLPISNLLQFASLFLLLALCYVFSDSLLKISLATIICESIFALLYAPAVMGARWLFHQPPYTNMIPGDGFAFPLTLIFAYILYRIIIIISKSWFSSYKEREPQHRRILACICILFISWNKIGFWIVNYTLLSPVIPSFFLVAIFITVTLIIRNRRLKQQNYYLLIQQTLLEEHYATLLNHVTITTEFYDELNHYIDDIKHFSELNTPSPAVKQYARDLLSSYNDLACENYCSESIINYFLSNIIHVDGDLDFTITVDFDDFNAGDISIIDILGILHHLYSYILNDFSKNQKFSLASLLIKSYCDGPYLVLAFEMNSFEKSSISPSLLHPGIKLVQALVHKYDGSLKTEVNGQTTCLLARIQRNVRSHN